MTTQVGPITICNNLYGQDMGTLTTQNAVVTEMHLRYYAYEPPPPPPPTMDGTYNYWDQDLHDQPGVGQPVADAADGYVWNPGVGKVMSAEHWYGLPVKETTDVWIVTFDITSPQRKLARVHDLTVEVPSFELLLSFDYEEGNQDVFYRMTITAGSSVLLDRQVDATPVVTGSS